MPTSVRTSRRTPVDTHVLPNVSVSLKLPSFSDARHGPRAYGDPRDDALRPEERMTSTLPGADSVGTEPSVGTEIGTPKSHRWLDMLDSPYTEAEVGAFPCCPEFRSVKQGSLLLGSPSNNSGVEFWRSRNSNECEERQECESKLDGQGEKDRLGRIEVV